MGTLALIGLGSNLGERAANLGDAVAALAETPGVEVRGLSSFHETEPVGGPPGQGPFLNAAAALETTLDPFALHARLRQIEDAAGRVRSARWGARTLDLDLLLFSDRILHVPRLQVPHPRMVVRRFVLAPLAEVAPEATDPITGRTVAGLLANLDRRPSYLALSRWWTDARYEAPFQRLASELGAVALRALDDAPPAPRPDRFRSRIGGEPAALLARWVDRLRADRYGALGDRWLISDFAYREAAFEVAPGAVDLAEDAVLPPTLIVLGPRPEGAERVGGFLSVGLPSLWLDAQDPDGIVAEVLAACAATRAGLPDARLPVAPGRL